MGSDETATATTGGPRVIDVFDGNGRHRAQIIYFFRMQIGSRTPSGIGLGSGSRLRRMRNRLGLPGELWIENLGILAGDGWLAEMSCPCAIYRWKRPRMRRRRLRTTNTTQSDPRETSGPRIDRIPPARPPWWRRQFRELKKLIFSAPSTCPIDLFGPVANRTILAACRISFCLLVSYNTLAPPRGNYFGSSLRYANSALGLCRVRARSSSECQFFAAGTPVDAALCRPAFLQQAASRRGATAPVLRKRMQRAVPAAPAATPESQSRPKMKQPAAEKTKLPTTLVAALLCAFSVTQALAAIASKGGQREYPYKVVASTLLSETFKIVCSAFFLMREISTLNEIDRKRALQCTAASVATAAVPGVAYQVLNNLNFVTLYYVDAPTFQILGNLKIVATGLAGQVYSRENCREENGSP